MYQIFYYLQNVHSVGGATRAAVAILGVAFSLWMAFDCWKRQGESYWIWLILFSGGLFALIYFITQYWDGSRVEYGLWKRVCEVRRIRELRVRARQLNTAASYETLGDAYIGVSKYGEAEAAYNEALRRQPEIFDAKVRLGYALLEQGRVEEAWPLLARAYQEKPDYDYDRLVWNLARCQAKRHQLEDARKLYEYFLTKHSYSQAQIEYAQVLTQMGECEASRATLNELLSDMEFSPRYARARERRWARAAKKLLRSTSSVP